MKLARRTRRRLALVAVIAVAVMIFILSAQDSGASSDVSRGVTEAIIPVFEPEYPRLEPPVRRIYLRAWHSIVRKAAHFSEFALLGATLLNYLRLWRRDKRLVPVLLPAWAIATLYALTDELHQRFVSGRGPSLVDVGIDSAGALTGALLAIPALLLFFRLRKRFRRRRRRLKA